MVARGLIDCPAKINVFLRVFGRRDDGYHELETVFHTIDLADSLAWQPGGEWRFSVEGGPDYGADELVRRAAKAYARKAGVALTGHAHLVKRIPAGAGLGGGSSDAAGMLMLLNQEYGALSSAQLSAVALEIGSDVPFFLTRGCQWGRGRGEDLMPCDWKLPAKGGFLFMPEFQMSTAEVFNALDAPKLGEQNYPNERPWVKELGTNDLFEPACRVEPSMREIAEAIEAVVHPDPFFMSGSGCSLVWLTDQIKVPKSLASVLGRHKVAVRGFKFIE